MQEDMNQAHDCAFNKEVIREYYDAMHSCALLDSVPMDEFKERHADAYRHFCAVHRKRVVVRDSVNAMKIVSEKVYFGTLTYNCKKNENKESSKRKEAFKFLNSVFEYVLLVEEYGEDNGRYHIHFLGVFKLDHDFDSFTAGWAHSRQNLRLLKENENISQYLCKYLTKNLPRIRRNKSLIQLARGYHRAKRISKHFPDVQAFEPETVCKTYHFINALDVI